MNDLLLELVHRKHLTLVIAVLLEPIGLIGMIRTIPVN
jgi:hypothetical protein